jgi:N utilization substance protein A
VQQVNRGNIIVNLGRAEALLPWREQIRREQYRQGDTIRAMIIDVQRNAKGPQIILSRASGEFLLKLFEQEVPEILEGIVVVKAVAREAGGRSKIAVASNEFRVDPVGACVGMKGSRVQGIVRELSGERIDIVPYSEDPIAFVTKALSPAKILQTIPDEENRKMQVVVSEDQLSLAIGKSGQNARLAAKLTGWEIDLVSEEEFAVSRGETPRSSEIPAGEIEGLGPKTIESLIQGGFESVQDIVKATIEDLINVPGVGDVTAQKIYLAAVRHLEMVEEERIRAEAEAAAEAEPAAEVETEAGAEGETPEATEDAGDAVKAAGTETAPEAETAVETTSEAETETETERTAEVEAEAPAEPESGAETAAEPSEPESGAETTAEASEPESGAETTAKPAEPSGAEDAGDRGGATGAASGADKESDSYLDDIEAMESELSAGWGGDEGDAPESPEKSADASSSGKTPG